MRLRLGSVFKFFRLCNTRIKEFYSSFHLTSFTCINSFTSIFWKSSYRECCVVRSIFLLFVKRCFRFFNLISYFFCLSLLFNKFFGKLVKSIYNSSGEFLITKRVDVFKFVYVFSWLLNSVSEGRILNYVINRFIQYIFKFLRCIVFFSDVISFEL